MSELTGSLSAFHIDSVTGLSDRFQPQHSFRVKISATDKSTPRLRLAKLTSHPVAADFQPVMLIENSRTSDQSCIVCLSNVSSKTRPK